MKCARALLMLSLAARLGAQGNVPEMFLAPDLIVPKAVVNSQAQWKPGPLIVLPDGRVVFKSQSQGTVGALSATGAPLHWTPSIGYRGDKDLAFADRLFASGNSVWVVDNYTKQIAQLGAKGEIIDAVPYPTWVYPHWGDRRKYPLFGRMEAHAVYPNGDLLVRPLGPRTLFDTKGYDRSLVHLLRITKGGAIESEVATFPDEDNGAIVLRGEERGNSHVLRVPFHARSFWKVAGDGSRVTLVRPGVTSADSGTFLVTALGEKGDTVFTRRFPMPAVRVEKRSADSALAKIGGYGSESAQQLRDRVGKRIPQFRSYVADVITGADHSTWIIQRPLSDTAKARTALVLGARGEPVARVALPDSLTLLAVDRTHLWATTKIKPVLVRFKLQGSRPPAIPAQPSRTATTSRGKD